MKILEFFEIKIGLTGADQSVKELGDFTQLNKRVEENKMWTG